MRVAIIGAGRAGTSLSIALARVGHRVSLVHHDELGRIGDVDLVLLAVPDDAIPTVAAQLPIDPARVVAVLGPSISGAAYQVGEEVARRFADHAGALAPDGPGHWRLDLRAVAAAQLERLGVEGDRVLVTAEATDGGATFFSDRAERPTGRFALVVRRRP